MKPSDKADVDQCAALMVETLPGLWRGLYEGLLERGFTAEECLRLLDSFIMSGQMGLPVWSDEEYPL